MPIDLKMAELQQTIGSPGWNETLVPLISQRAKMLYDQLLEPSKTRQDKLPDDFIRGQIAALRWVVSGPRELVEAAVRASSEEEAAKDAAPIPPMFGGT